MTSAKAKTLLNAAGWIILAAAVCVFCVIAMRNLSAGQNSAGRDQLEQAIRRSAAACYASEGYYPPTIDYITEHYGIQIDESTYAVFYDAFADNLMPDITVVEK